MSVARCLEINARLRAAGIPVREAGGWQSRGNGQTSAYEGGLVHHTATGHGIAIPGTGVGNLLINGRPDLRGPLCNYAGNDDGTITVIAAHPANHAGASGGRSMGPLPVTTLFNRRVMGLEIVYPGTSPMRTAQYRSALVWAKAVADVCGGGDIRRVRAHAETSITGKFDPGDAPGRTIDMAAFRDAARNVEDDVTPEEHRWLKFVFDRVAGILAQRYYVGDPKDPTGETVREVPADAPGARPARVLDTLDGNFLSRRLSPMSDDEARILAAVQRVQEAVEAQDEAVTPEQLDQLAEALATKLSPELLDDFDAKLRAAVARNGR
ncbi:MAG: N-acetylmuramoyl-L-alanine amidase [Actinophytocola sp.]|uniref:peptidoglycan recognition protein family protein n=1 Tax=Actinophytocola sp. TaxID=1872138 RepID=UPI003C74E19A